MKTPSACKECGSQALSWAADNQTTSGVQNGRLRLSDVRGVFVLGCDDCSATLSVVSADLIAQRLTNQLREEQ